MGRVASTLATPLCIFLIKRSFRYTLKPLNDVIWIQFIPRNGLLAIYCIPSSRSMAADSDSDATRQMASGGREPRPKLWSDCGESFSDSHLQVHGLYHSELMYSCTEKTPNTTADRVLDSPQWDKSYSSIDSVRLSLPH